MVMKDSYKTAGEVYLNRLSDVLFVLARWANARMKIEEPVWERGN